MQSRGGSRLAEPWAQAAHPGETPRKGLKIGALFVALLLDQGAGVGFQDDDRLQLLVDVLLRRRDVA